MYYHFWKSTPHGYTAELTLVIVCLIVSLVPLCHVLYHYLCRPQDTSENESETTNQCIKILTAASMLCFCIALLIRAVYIYLKLIGFDIETADDEFTEREYLIAPLSAVPRFFWGIGEALIHLLFVNRLRIAFENTTYASSRRIYHVLYVAILLFLICVLIIAVQHILHHFREIEPITYYTLNFVFTLLFTMIDFAVSTYLVALFILKLFRLIVDIEPTANGRGYSVYRRFTTLNEEQGPLANVITKYFILNTVAIATTNVTQLVSMAAKIAYITSHNDDWYHALNDTFWLFWILDSCVNCCCIWLQLALAERWYNLCCRKMHVCCALCCKRLAINQIEAANSDYVLMKENKFQL